MGCLEWFTPTKSVRVSAIDKSVVYDFGAFHTYVEFAGGAIPQGHSRSPEAMEVIVLYNMIRPLKNHFATIFLPITEKKLSATTLSSPCRSTRDPRQARKVFRRIMFPLDLIEIISDSLLQRSNKLSSITVSLWPSGGPWELPFASLARIQLLKGLASAFYHDCSFWLAGAIGWFTPWHRTSFHFHP